VVVSDNVQLECSPDGRVHTLVIEKVGADDEGEYTVRATTDSAQISSSASIVIQRRLHTCTRKRSRKGRALFEEKVLILEIYRF